MKRNTGEKGEDDGEKCKNWCFWLGKLQRFELFDGKDWIFFSMGLKKIWSRGRSTKEFLGEDWNLLAAFRDLVFGGQWKKS